MSLPGVRPTHVEIIHSTENHTPFTKEDINGTGESIGEYTCPVTVCVW